MDSNSESGSLLFNTNQPNIIDKLQEYTKQRLQPIKIYILTPCFGATCHIGYLISIINTITLLNKLGIQTLIEFCKNDSLIPRARNNLIAKAMSDPLTTHMLFIDNDITWDPIDIIKLIVSNKTIIGGIYPLKKYDWSKITEENLKTIIDKKNRNSSHFNSITHEKFIQNNLLNYNVNYLSNTLNIDNNLTKVRHLPTGFMMIQRECIEQLQIAYKDTKYIDDVGYLTTPEENAMSYALFDCGVVDGHYYSEDWMFCSRWAKLGGEVWIDITINLTHTGVEDYNGSYLASII